MNQFTEIDTHIIGYPCYKTILRSLSSKTNIPEFERFLFGIGKMDGLDDTALLKQLTDLLDQYLYDGCDVIREDFFALTDFPVDKEKLPEFILKNRKIKTHSQCTAYYRNFQSGKNACAACPRSPIFANEMLKIELSILHFMLLSEDNTHTILKAVEDENLHFFGVFDIFYDIRIKRAFFVPLNQYFYSYIFYYSKTLFFPDFLKNVKIQEDLLEELFLEDYIHFKEIPAEFLKKLDIPKVTVKRHLSRILESPIPNASEIPSLLKEMNDFKQAREEKKSTFSKTEPAKRSTAILYSVSTAKSGMKTKEEKPISDMTPPIGSSKEKEDITPSFLLSNSENKTDGKKNSPAKLSNPKDSLLPLKKHASDSKQELFPSFCGNAILLAEFTESVYADHCVAVEVTDTKDGLVLSLYSKKKHLFYSSILKEPLERKSIGKILSKERIKKICHTPYLLYAFGYEHGISIKGVHALETEEYLLHHGDLLSLSDLLLKYPIGPQEEWKEKVTHSKNLLFDAMRHYKDIYTKQISKKKTVSEDLREYERAIGYSYCLSGCFIAKKYLFYVSKDRRFIFQKQINPEDKDKIRYSGFFVTYAYALDTHNAASIMKTFLCNLSKENIIGRFNIFIITLTDNQISFFIMRDEFDYLDGYITTSLRIVGVKFGHSNLPLSVILEYRDVPDEKEET